LCRGLREATGGLGVSQADVFVDCDSGTHSGTFLDRHLLVRHSRGTRSKHTPSTTLARTRCCHTQGRTTQCVGGSRRTPGRRASRSRTPFVRRTTERAVVYQGEEERDTPGRRLLSPVTRSHTRPEDRPRRETQSRRQKGARTRTETACTRAGERHALRVRSGKEGLCVWIDERCRRSTHTHTRTHRAAVWMCGLARTNSPQPRHAEERDSDSDSRDDSAHAMGEVKLPSLHASRRKELLPAAQTRIDPHDTLPRGRGAEEGTDTETSMLRGSPKRHMRSKIG